MAPQGSRSRLRLSKRGKQSSVDVGFTGRVENGKKHKKSIGMICVLAIGAAWFMFFGSLTPGECIAFLPPILPGGITGDQAATYLSRLHGAPIALYGPFDDPALQTVAQNKTEELSNYFSSLVNGYYDAFSLFAVPIQNIVQQKAEPTDDVPES
eukprot:GHVT01061583.1.p1 GENE.GHVT01061583.1~~GHVT01061583.1.p1  ORF type:complete len:154 (-),score=16.65 GHVT01061583.1:407-868(-)